jgi:hypothetical protein
MRFAGFVLIALAISGRATAQGDRAQELKQLEGTWDVIAFEVDGKVQPKEKSPKQIVITGDKLTGLGPEMTISVDPTKSTSGSISSSKRRTSHTRFEQFIMFAATN